MNKIDIKNLNKYLVGVCRYKNSNKVCVVVQKSYEVFEIVSFHYDSKEFGKVNRKLYILFAKLYLLITNRTSKNSLKNKKSLSYRIYSGNGTGVLK